MKLRSLKLLSLGFLPLIAACSGAAEDTDQSEDDLSLPSYVITKTTEFGCADVVRDKFAGSDSAHGYKVDAKKGRSYHFEFAAHLEGEHQASLALFDAATKKRVAVQRGNERLALDFTPEADKSYVVAAYTSRRQAKGDYKFKQFCAIDGQNALEPGQTSFESEERDPSMWRFGMAAERSNSPVAAGAPSGRSGPVEEADVYKVDGSRLFYLNTYRGFLAYDISNPKAPKQIGRLPIYGRPVEMFVQNSVVYALMSDVLELRDVEGRLRFEKKRTSQLIAIDISNPAQPKVLETVDIKGELREGLSRKVGDTIYVVTQDWAYSFYQNQEQAKEQAWVYSFNAANPKDVKLVQKLKVFEGGAGNESTDGQSSGRWFNGVTISATSNALMVVENWHTYASVWGSGYQCGSSTSQQQAVVSIIDISNPSGAIKLHTKFETYGRLGDQFKQAYVYNPQTQKATYYGIFARQEWQSANCTGSSNISNQIEAWDVTNGASPVQIGKLKFGKPNETVRGSAFDLDRGVVYSITAERVDPLYAIDIKNPSSLKVLSAVDGLSGDMNLFRFIGDKKFLLAVGTDNSHECEGFNSPATGWTSKVQASIIDVQDATKVKLVQRKCITVNDAQWMGSEVNWNLDQAHKLIGMYESGLTNLVSVPVHYTKKIPSGNGWDSYKSETAVGLLSWDLTKYDPTKAPAQQIVLENASTVVHAGGEVKRTVIFNHPGLQSRRKLLNLSNTHLSITDIENPKAPIADSTVEIAPYKDRVIAFGGHVVEQIQPYTDYGWMENGVTELRVKAKGPNVDDAPAIATFTAPSVERALKFGDDTLVLFQRKTSYANNNYSTELTAQVYDLSNPAQPRKAGSVKLPVDYVSYPRFAAGASSYWFPYWGDAQDMVQTDSGFVFLTTTWSQSGNQQRKLVALDLRNADSPSVTTKSLSNDTNITMLGLARDEDQSGGSPTFWLSYKKTVPGTVNRDGTEFTKAKYVAQKFSWNGASLVAGSTVNVPGKVVRSYPEGGHEMLVTHDRFFDVGKTEGTFQESPRLVVSRLVGNLASVEDTHTLWGMNLADLVLDEGRLYTNLTERTRSSWGPIMPFERGIMRWTPPVSELRIFDVSSTKIGERFAEELVGTEGVELMGVHEKRLFVNLAGDGVLLVDASNATKPTARRFVRTLGWAWSAEVSGNDVLIPSGHYGTYQMPLYGQGNLIDK